MTFDPETNEHPLPAQINEPDGCTTYAIYLTLKGATMTADDMATAIAALWATEPDPPEAGKFQDILVYRCRR